MRLRLRFFAAAREALGRSEMPLEVPDGSTVGELLERLRGEHPAFAALPAEMMVSVNLEYQSPGHVLREGDEVAFIPPVSGGSTGEQDDAAPSAENRRERTPRPEGWDACSRSPISR
jgi:molybdopterin converting factor subunit 1